MSPARAPRIRFALRSIRAGEARALAEDALKATEPSEVRAALDRFAFARPDGSSRETVDREAE
jgi:signal transduction protein with GAF and PtsI domain